MKFEILNKEEMSVACKVIFSHNDIEKKVDEAVKKRAVNFKMDGFRKGHVPLKIVRSHVENQVLQGSLESLISSASDQILSELGNPDLTSKPVYKFISNYQKEKDLELALTFELAPVFELLPYNNLKIKKIIPSVSKDEINKESEILVKTLPLFEKAPNDYIIKALDKVSYQANCFVNGVESKKKSFSNIIQIPESVPSDAEFINNFIGKKIGESFEFVPATDKSSKYIVVIKLVEKALTELSLDEYASKSDFKTVDKLHEFVKNQIEAEINSSAFLYHKQQILEYMGGVYDFKLPKPVLENEMRNVIASIKRELEHEKLQGTASEEDLKKTDDDLRKEYSEVVNKRVLLGYVLNKIAKTEKINASEKEVQNAILFEMRRNPLNAERILEYYSNNQGAIAYKKAEIIEQKVILFLIDKAEKEEEKKTKQEMKEMLDKIFEDGEE